MRPAGEDGSSAQAVPHAEVGAQVPRGVSQSCPLWPQGCPDQPAAAEGELPGLQGGLGKKLGAEGAGVTGRSRGSREQPEEILVWGSPAAVALQRPLLGLWPSEPVISDLGAPGWVLGLAWGASGVRELLFLASAAGARQLFIDQTIRSPCVNGTPRASRAQTFQAPLSPRPLGLPVPAPPPGLLPPEPHRPPRPCMAKARRAACVSGAPAPPRASRSA